MVAACAASRSGAGLPEAYEALYARVEAQYPVPSEGCFAFGIEGVAPAIARFGSAPIRQQALPKIFASRFLIGLVTCFATHDGIPAVARAAWPR